MLITFKRWVKLFSQELMDNQYKEEVKYSFPLNMSLESMPIPSGSPEQEGKKEQFRSLQENILKAIDARDQDQILETIAQLNEFILLESGREALSKRTADIKRNVQRELDRFMKRINKRNRGSIVFELSDNYTRIILGYRKEPDDSEGSIAMHINDHNSATEVFKTWKSLGGNT